LPDIPRDYWQHCSQGRSRARINRFAMLASRWRYEHAFGIDFDLLINDLRG